MVLLNNASSSQADILTRNLLELLVGQRADELGGENLQRVVGSCNKEEAARLHTDVVDESLSGDLVVSLENVMDLEDRVLSVRHGVVLYDVVERNRAMRDTAKGRSLNGGMLLEGCAKTLLTAMVWQVSDSSQF
jgi:hypothetical protein